MKKRIRVLIADDHAPTREEVRFAIERDEAFEVVAEAADAPGAIDAAVAKLPAVCLLDVHMPGGGVSAVWEICARVPTTKVVMLTVSREDQDVLAALKAGAMGYLLKDMDPRRIPHALLSVLDGEVAVPRALVGAVIDEVRDRTARRRTTVGDATAVPLTSREWQVVDLARKDLTTAQIARRLTVSPITVRTHLNAAMKKLGVADREGLRAHLEGR